MTEKQVSHIIVESIYNAGVRVVFGIPGAKIDTIFDTLSYVDFTNWLRDQLIPLGTIQRSS